MSHFYSAAALLACLTAAGAGVAQAAPIRTLPGHIPAAVQTARVVANLDPARTLPLALTLPLRNQPQLSALLLAQQNPRDPRFGHYLTPQEFAERFAPTQADYDRTAQAARALGLTVTATHPNRTVLDVAAPAGVAERAFGLHLRVYQSGEDGRYFFAPDGAPRVGSGLSAVSGVVGLDNAARRHPQAHRRDTPGLSPLLDMALTPYAGTGPNGGFAPSDIKTAYGLSGVSQTGSGQTLALFELDGYKATDIAAYEAKFGLPAVPLQNVLVDGYSGEAGTYSFEVTLDIQLQAALAPGASKIIVYEGPNSDVGVVDTYNRIATDNAAKEISTSWGDTESRIPAAVRAAENTAFQQMAAQGQSIFAASGDSGAYDDGATLSVDDPASQPYMTGVGGTTLTTNGAGGAYLAESVWDSHINGWSGGGGISTVWSLPPYQAGLAGSAASLGSQTMRNVPDVSLDADPQPGYAVYINDQWAVFGGTSCAAPLWAAFTALVNQRRTANGLPLLGFANPPLYALAGTASYKADFHDIADGSTNRYYPAVTGYDDATGLGTFVGAALLADLSGGASAALANGSFEQPRVGTGGYQYNPVGSAWTFAGNSGIQANGSAWGAAPAPDGTQTAFLQTNPGQRSAAGVGINGAISQTVTLPTSGTYVLTFQAARRQGQVQPLRFSVDGTPLGGLLIPPGSDFAPLTTAAFTLSAGSHTLTLAATALVGDVSTLVDQVALTPVASAPVLANGSFEQPSVGAAAYQYNPAGAAWTFTGNSGVQSNGSPWNAAPASDGTQTAFLQSNPGQTSTAGVGVNGSMSQTITAAPGTYALTFQAARRYSQPQPVQVSVDGVAVGSPITPSGSAFSGYTSASFVISGAGAHTVRLSATASGGDVSTLIDQVAVVAK